MGNFGLWVNSFPEDLIGYAVGLTLDRSLIHLFIRKAA